MKGFDPTGGVAAAIVKRTEPQPALLTTIRMTEWLELVREREALLEACEAALEFAEGQEDVVDGDYGIPAPNRAMNLCNTLRAALGKRPAP